MWLCFFLYTGSMRSNLLRLRSRSERTSLATTTACRLQQPHLTDRDSGDEDRHQHTGGKDAERRLAAAWGPSCSGERGSGREGDDGANCREQNHAPPGSGLGFYLWFDRAGAVLHLS